MLLLKTFFVNFKITLVSLCCYFFSSTKSALPLPQRQTWVRDTNNWILSDRISEHVCKQNIKWNIMHSIYVSVCIIAALSHLLTTILHWIKNLISLSLWGKIIFWEENLKLMILSGSMESADLLDYFHPLHSPLPRSCSKTLSLVFICKKSFIHKATQCGGSTLYSSCLCDSVAELLGQRLCSLRSEQHFLGMLV